MQTFLQVQEEGTATKSTSSLLTKAIGLGLKFLVGADAFKSAWNNAPTSRSGIAIATNQTPEQLDAQLRLSGIDPNTYYDSLGRRLGDNIGAGMGAADLNGHLVEAQKDAKDSSQMNWLWAAGGLLLLLAFSRTGRGRKLARRAYVWGRGHYRVAKSRYVTAKWRRRRGRR